MAVTEVPQPTQSAVPAERPADARRLAKLEERVDDLDRRVENNRLVRDTWTLIIFAVAAVALVASVIAVGFGMRAIDEAERHAEASLAPLAVVLAATRTSRPARTPLPASFARPGRPSSSPPERKERRSTDDRRRRGRLRPRPFWRSGGQRDVARSKPACAGSSASCEPSRPSPSRQEPTLISARR